MSEYIEVKKMNGELCRETAASYNSKIEMGNIKNMICKIFTRLIFWLGAVVIALLALPTGILFLMICGIWTAVDKLTSVIGGKTK